MVDEAGTALAREMHITRLSEGVDATGELSPAALERTFAVLSAYAGQMATFGVGARRIVATSAARDARNSAEFLEPAARIVGAPVEILSGLEEATLSYAGATADLDAAPEATLIVDIGGGSTELAARVDGELVAVSMQVGCVRVTERALGAGIVDDRAESRARDMIGAELDRAFRAAPALSTLVGAVRLVGLAGTVATLAQMDAGLAVYDREAVHHRLMSRADVTRWRVRLGAEEPTARLAHPGMVVGREDVLVAGLLVLEMVMDRFQVDRVLSSECDILDGLVSSLR